MCWLGSQLLRAQEPRVEIPERQRPQPTPTGGASRLATDIRINADLVLVPVMVSDAKDRMITGLEKGQFRLFDEKVEQVITHFASEDAPISIAILFDCSGSMGAKLTKSRAAVSAFLAAANPNDEFSLVFFNDEVNLVAPFTDRTDEIQTRMMSAGSKGQTALLDAVYLALHQMKHARYSRKAILIVSDGGDNSSRYSYGEVRRCLRETDAQVYSIGILEPFESRGRSAEEMSGVALLDAIARETGGRLFEVNELNELQGIAAKIGEAMRTQYVLGFTPTQGKADSKYHRVQVKIQGAKSLRALRVSFRAGYYAR
jgi:VWFA-related protein